MQSVRHYTHEANGQKALALRIVTTNRSWELVSSRGAGGEDAARRWTELLGARIRSRTRDQTMAETTEVQAAATFGRQATGIIPQSTRL